MDGTGIFRMIFGLILVIGAILLSAWFARRFGIADIARGRVPGMRLLSTLSVGPRQRLAIVAVEDARLVVGISPQGITLLHTMPPAPEEPVAEVPVPGGFQALLGKWLDTAKR